MLKTDETDFDIHTPKFASRLFIRSILPTDVVCMYVCWAEELVRGKIVRFTDYAQNMQAK